MFLKDKLCTGLKLMRHCDESLCSVAQRPSAQLAALKKQRHSMIWIPAIFVPLQKLLAAQRQPRQPSYSDLKGLRSQP